MNNYSSDIYSEIVEFDAVYNNRAAYNKKSKNARRAQRKAKQAQRDARYDGF